MTEGGRRLCSREGGFDMDSRRGAEIAEVKHFLLCDLCASARISQHAGFELFPVIPAKAGIQLFLSSSTSWIPAFAGMTGHRLWQST
jgi:hypothetical protein